MTKDYPFTVSDKSKEMMMPIAQTMTFNPWHPDCNTLFIVEIDDGAKNWILAESVESAIELMAKDVFGETKDFPYIEEIDNVVIYFPDQLKGKRINCEGKIKRLPDLVLEMLEFGHKPPFVICSTEF